MKKLPLKALIFAGIGVLNTLLDLVLYVVFSSVFGIPKAGANIMSTSLALVFSYFMNSRFTFKAQKFTRRSFILYIVVTLFGLWVLQTVIIYALTHLLGNRLDFLPTALATAFPKLCATAVTLVWNYVWYNKVIFKDKPVEDALMAADETLPLTKP